jgi:hypothetical protein
MNVLVETLDNNLPRETPFNEPAVETVNARLEQVGVFRDDSVGANQSAAAMALQATDANAPTAYVAGRAGTIVGVVARMVSTTTHGAIASGTATAQATIGGVAAGTAVVMTATADTQETAFKTPVAFKKGDLLGITLASASLSPTTSLGVAWLLIRWTAAS